MDNYSLPRRIWRIFYPVLIFIGIQIFVGVGIEIVVALATIVNDTLRSTSGADISVFVNTMTRFVYDNGTFLVLVCNLFSFGVFWPIWLTMSKRLERFENSNPVSLGIAIAGFFAGFNIVQLIVFGLTDIMKFFPSYEEVSDMLSSGTVLIQVIAIGFSAPIVEEIVFRGILLNRMKWLPVWAAVLIQALLFGFVHFNLFQSLYAFLAGIMLGLVYVKYKSLVFVIIGHVSYNLSSVLLAEFSTDAAAAAVILISPVIMIVCAVFLLKHVPSRLSGLAQEPQNMI